jgi:hypothetical protein
MSVVLFSDLVRRGKTTILPSATRFTAETYSVIRAERFGAGTTVSLPFSARLSTNRPLARRWVIHPSAGTAKGSST